MAKAELYLGTSGWSYPQWKNTFYPQGMKDKVKLAHYATQFNAVEINNSFYAIPRPDITARWAASTPERFRLCIKAWRGITHDKNLNGCQKEIDTFLASLLQDLAIDQPFIYMRHHGAGIKYGGPYSNAYLQKLKSGINIWLAKGKPTYVFFNNTMGAATLNARFLKTC